MTKRLLSTALIMVLMLTLLPTVPVMAATTPESDFIFNKNTGTITEYIGPGGDVVIPATIGGVPVTAIGSRAFEEKTL